MTKIFLPAFLLIAFTACQNSDGGGEGSAVPASPNTTSSPAPQTPVAPPTTTSTAQPGTNSSGAALNPPHGEPGHICEIPVGQPLDGSAASAAAGSPQEIMIDPSQMNGGTTTITPNMQPASSSTTAPGMNPPHGEPGHVCEIPVGQPLP